MSGETLADAGEFGFLGDLLPTLPSSRAVTLGPGDDGAVFRVDGEVVVSTDALVEGVHFRRDWSSAADIGARAVAQNVADLEAMGADPVAMVIALSAPGATEISWLRELMAGVVEESEKAGIVLVGGDTTSGPVVMISVTVMGQTAGVPPVTRTGARDGDVVALCGRIGWSAAGLAVLSRGFRSPRSVVAAHRRPEPPYGQGRVAAQAGATAMMDVSDGLIQDVGHIAAGSGVGIDLDRDALEIPDDIQAVAQATGADALALVLTGGEDHALVATFPRSVPLPEGWRAIGQVHTGEGVSVDGEPYLAPGGWDHFHR